MLIELVSKDGKPEGYLRSEEVAMIRYVPSENDYNVWRRGVEEATVVSVRTGNEIMLALEGEDSRRPIGGV